MQITFAHVTMTMVRVIVTMVMPIVLRIQLASIIVKVIFAIKHSQAKPTVSDNVFLGIGRGSIFDVIISYPTSQLKKLFYSSIFFLTVAK